MITRIERRIYFIIGCAALAYVGIYVFLSLCGSYQPEIVGAGGVKTYAWAPLGFYDSEHPAWPGSAYAVRHPTEPTGGWRAFFLVTFYPLWVLDNRYIHSPNRKPS